MTDTKNNGKWFGASVLRKEDTALLSGRGTFVDDITLPGMLYAAVLRSPFPHARINGIDTSAALALPGVHAVLTYHDLPDSMQRQTIPLLVPNPAIRQLHMQHCLAKDEVCYVGDPVALVVADSRYIAEDAAPLVAVDYEALPSISDCREAIVSSAARCHAGVADNIAAQVPIIVGDVDAAFAKAPHVFREALHQHRGGPFSMECRGMIASADRITGSLMVYVSSQGPHRHKRVFLDLLELGDHQIRIVTPDVGGGFGPKGAFYPEYGAIAAATFQLGQPVKWIEDRRENFVTTHQERDQYWNVEIAVDDQAKILGVRGRLVHDTGAYLPWGLVLPWIAATTVPGPYIVPAFRMEVVVAYTNKVATSPVRGAGRPEAVFVMERLMDRVAGELNVDRAEVRRRNFIQPSQMPYQVGIIFRDGRPVTYDSGDYPTCQAKALEFADMAGFAQRQAAARAAGRYIGIGLSNAVEGTGLGPFESANVRIATNGKIVVYTGATPQGQSHKTTLAQIAADQLGVTPDDVTIVTADTAATALGVGSFAARTAVNAGSSVHLAAIEVATKVKKLAAEMLEVAADDLELVDGFAQVKGVANLRKSFREIAVKSVGMPGVSMSGPPGLDSTAYFTPSQSVFSNGTHIAEVEVDIETGHVTILRYIVMHDCGHVINPMVVEGQIVGGVVHGIGNAFLERMVYDENAQPLSTNFAEYLLPVASDAPPNIAVHHMTTPSPLNPLGMKGAGEGGTIASIAALIGAVENALGPFDVHIAEAPIMPQRLVELLGKAAFGRTR